MGTDHKTTSALLLSLVVTCGQAAGTELGSEEFRLPLFGPYAILRADLHLLDQQSGRYQLVEESGGTSSHFLVVKLKEFAVSGRTIAGSTEDGYFVLDASRHDVQPQIFVDAQQWQGALRRAHVPTNIQFQNADTVAATMADQQIHPWRYRMMKGRLGWQDEEWAAIIELTGLLVVFLRSLLVRSSSSPLAIALLLGLLVNVAAELMINGGGPAAFVGFLMFPLIYLVVGQLGRFLRWVIWDRRAGKRRTTLLERGASSI